ncbi:MAG: ABC transporter substrate-binding protein [Deltaproteobacteria bacterium]|nr:ABC transporter substrate-binding protein [Deltaproteobacteria bacterium]
MREPGSGRARWNLRWAALIAGAMVSAGIGCSSPHLRRIPGNPRIISLAPSVTETLFALGIGAEVVGVSQYCDYPPQVRRLPKIGSFITPNLEQIIALRPTLVIGLLTSSDVRQVRALQGMSIATLMVDDGSVAAIETSIERIGAATRQPGAARELVARIRSRINAVEEKLSSVPSKGVLMVVGHQPLVAVGPGTYLDELLTLAHGRNIARPSGQSWPRLSLEYIVALRPEVILDGQMGSDPQVPSRFWSRYPSIPAVRAGRVFGYPDDPTLHPGPRVADTLELLARLIHPDAFANKWKLAAP